MTTYYKDGVLYAVYYTFNGEDDYDVIYEPLC